MPAITDPYALWCDVFTSLGACAVIYSLFRASPWTDLIRFLPRRTRP